MAYISCEFDKVLVPRYEVENPCIQECTAPSQEKKEAVKNGCIQDCAPNTSEGRDGFALIIIVAMVGVLALAIGLWRITAIPQSMASKAAAVAVVAES
jgi:hypothetical protein